jgi:glycosyltransferase involved in cell wall biosynthesis
VSERRRLLVGVVVHTDVAALHGTLDALADALDPGDRVVLVPDGPDALMARALREDARLTGMAQLGVDQPRGNPASFNRLACALADDEGALVLLENGARPAPDALDRLAAALDRTVSRADAGGPRPADSTGHGIAARADGATGREGAAGVDGTDGPGGAPDDWVTVGLAGPSTNDAWNEQQALPDATGDPDGLREAGGRLAAVYGDGLRSLAPLHAPAELCLAVSREALAAAGAADEGFGLGPCWEMEYAARVVRAGFATVWVGGAYVHRAPPTRRRRRHERLDFDAAKRRYQDRLCGLRLDGSRHHHVDHCAGDACAHFAPPDRIVVHLPLRRPVTPTASTTAVAPTDSLTGDGHRIPSPDDRPGAQADGGEGRPPCVVERAPVPSHRSAPATVAAAGCPVPLVSCVMPTCDRRDWLVRAIEYFHRQDHPAHARELIVVDDGDRDLSGEIDDLAGHPAVTYVRLPARLSIGAKRNLGFRRARGAILAQWDDDDWYGPDRLSRQVAPIVAGTADVTGLRDAVWFDVDRWRFRRPTATHHRHLFVEDVSGGTLVFHRAVWDRGVRYPDMSLAEDAALLRAALRRGFRLARLPAEGSYLYVRHGENSWQLRRRDDRSGWEVASEPPELLQRPDDRAFYAARSRVTPRSADPRTRPGATRPAQPAPPPLPVPAKVGAPTRTPVPTAARSSSVRAGDRQRRAPAAGPAVPTRAGQRPRPRAGVVVSGIMPTADRHDFLPAAIAGFLAQRCADAELVVVDDGDEPAGHLVPDDPRVRYIRLDGRRVLGEKRNLAVEAAAGEVIVHLDDDDWSHPERLQVQVDALRAGDVDVCGLARMLWWDPRRGKAWRYTSPPVRRPWVAGNTLAFLRESWERSPFPVQNLGEDTAFIWGDRRRRVRALDDERLVVGTLHSRNTSPKHTRSSAWTRVDAQEVLRIFDEAGVDERPVPTVLEVP